MEVDSPIPVFAYALARFLAFRAEFVQPFTRVVCCVGRSIRCTHPKSSVARLDRKASTISYAHPRLDSGNDTRGVVAFAMVANHASQQGVDGQILNLALDIPERKVESPDRIDFFTPRRVKESPGHVLPEAFGVMRISADQTSRTLFQQVFRSALAYARDPGIRFNRDH